MSSIFRKAERIRQSNESHYRRTRLRQEGVKEVKVYKKGKPTIIKVPIQKPIIHRKNGE